MLILRCTKKILDRIEATPSDENALPASTGRTGDWFVNLLFVGRQQLVLAVSAVTLLPVLLPAAPFKTIPRRLPIAVAQMLMVLGIEPPKVAAEVAGMGEYVVAKTNNRQVLGSMLDFVNMLYAYRDGRSLVDAALQLAEAPCGPIGMESPRSATHAVFDQVAPDRRRPALRLVK